MNGVIPVEFTLLPTVSDINWRVADTGDVDGDGKADLIWRHATQGWNSVWRMNGVTPRSSCPCQPWLT